MSDKNKNRFLIVTHYSTTKLHHVQDTTFSLIDEYRYSGDVTKKNKIKAYKCEFGSLLRIP